MTTENSKDGRFSRRIITLSAILVVAMFFTVPLTFAVGSDADYGTGEAGYTLEFTEKASKAELAKVGQSYEEIGEEIGEEIASVAGIDLSDLNVTDVSMETFKCEVSEGEKVENGKVTTVKSEDYDVKKISIVFKSDKTTDMFDDRTISTKMQKAISAIKTYFATSSFHAGDTVTITAESVKYVKSEEKITEYGEKNSTQCLKTSDRDTNGNLLVTKATVTYKPSGEEAKSITVDVDMKMNREVYWTYVYNTDLKDVKNLDLVTLKGKVTTKSLSYNLKITVDGTDHKVDDITGYDEEMTELIPAIVVEKSNIKLDSDLKNYCDNLKDSENVTTGAGFDKAESAYNSAVDKESPSGGGNNIVLIVVIVVVILAVIGGVAFFVIKKKKRA